jgi:hypothetical protein
MELKGTLIGQGRTAEVFEWGQTQILKLYRQEFPPQLAQLEARIGSAIAEAGLTAPKFEGLVALEGRTGLIYERVSGPSMLQLLSRQPWRCFSLACQFAQLQAQIHAHSAEQYQLPLQAELLKSSIERATPLTDQTKQKVLARLIMTQRN